MTYGLVRSLGAAETFCEVERALQEASLAVVLVEVVEAAVEPVDEGF